MNSNQIVVDRSYAAKFFPPRPQDSNKGTFGVVLNIAGSMYYTGAAFLSSLAAARAGAGLVKLASESATISAVSSQTPNITFIDLNQSGYGTIPKDALKYLKNLKDPSAIAIGCGLTTATDVREFVLKFLKNYASSSIPIVIDADAINIIAGEHNPILPLNSVMTPHPLELSRLLNVDVYDIQADRVKWAKHASSKFDCIIVLKGKNTVISVPNGNTFINTTGNSALAKGGTGDILTGLIAGLAAQKVRLEDACVLACYLHGRAGELASKKFSEYSTLPTDVLSAIPYAIREFFMTAE